MLRIAITSKDDATQWKADTYDLNEETKTLLEEVSAKLKEVKEFSDGTIIDEIFDIGTNLLTATHSMLEGMNKIYDTVEGLLSQVGGIIEAVTGFFSGTKNSVG